MNRPAETVRVAPTERTWDRVPGRRRPALWAAALLASGILAARYLPLSPVEWGTLAFAALVVLLAVGRHRPVALFLATVVVWLTTGAFRYAAETQVLPPNPVSYFLNAPEELEIFGRVVDLPDRRENATNLAVDVRSLKQGAQVMRVSGRILVRAMDTARHFSYGDFLRFSGKLQEPHVARNPGGFDYRRHLLDRGIHGVVGVAKNRRLQVYPDPDAARFLNRVIIPLREYILKVFRTHVPGPGGALLAGYLLGETREMPDSLYNAYRRSGVLHLLAVSGSNVWLVLGLFWFLFRLVRLPRVVQTAFLLAILVVFCFATRNEPSVVRAGLMAALVLLARLFYRRFDLANIVGVSAVVILLFSPRHLFLPGFQLSYAAVLGILLFVPRLLQLLPAAKRWRVARWVTTGVGSSIAANVATAPIIALHFGVIPIISVAANLVMVPLAGLVTNGALVLVLIGEFWSGAARFIGTLVGLAATWSIESARFFERIPLGQVLWPHPTVFEIAAYMLMLCAALAWRTWFRWLKFGVFAALVAAGAFAATRVFSPCGPLGEILFLDAGNDPLVGLFLTDGSGRLIGSPGAFSLSNEQWVIEPYAVSTNRIADRFIRDTLPLPYNCAVEDRSVHSTSLALNFPTNADGAIRHIRMVIDDTSSRPCPVSDFLAGTGFCVLILYTTDPDLVSHIVRLLPEPRLDVLAVASAMSSPGLADAFRDIEIHDVIIFGKPPGISSDVLSLAWTRQIPAQRIWSTARNGGVCVGLSSPLKVTATIR